MMRQTAATQVSLDFGTPAQMTRRWRVLERMAPTMIAAFARSPRHAGAETGHRSFRSHIWRTLDLARTGLVVAGDDPAADYIDFALDAPVMLRRPPDGEYPTLRTLVERGDANAADLADHLSTLFPEIRPRGHFEVRSTDAIPMDSLPALIVLLGGIVYDSSALKTAEEVLHGASPDLVAAGRAGLSDPSLACVARDLFEVAVSGCLRLGDSFLEREHLEEAAAFITACSARGASWNEREIGRSPATRDQAVTSLAAPR
jgi:glutamate--cysteine ligase